jgi:hypothetical protein
LLKLDGCFGLIATNTIGQGDTRSTGLRWICLHGGTIYRAKKRVKWPGEAAVVVSVVHAVRGAFAGPRVLDDRVVPKITAYLFYEGGHENPSTLDQNLGLAFRGCEAGSLGFLLSQAQPEFEMLCELADPQRPHLRVLKIYLGGEDLYAEPSRLDGARYIVDVDGWPESELARFPELKDYLAKSVRADLLTRNEINRDSTDWWHFRRPSIGLRTALGALPRLLACSRIGNALAFSYLPMNSIANEKTVVFAFETYASFALLQSRLHEVWARFFSSTLKDDLQYTPSDCFDSFPFPSDYEASEKLASAGETYYNYRAELMVKTDKGLTKTYNRFHDPEDQKPDIQKLRELHAEMDAAVLEAYDWSDLVAPCDFEPEFADEEEDDDFAPDGPKKPKKKKFRLRWRDEIRDKLLARLLELNRQRAAEQGTLVSAPEPDEPASKTKKKPEAQERLF